MSDPRRNGQFVVPGDKLGVIEEFIPDAGTYIEDGVIHSNNAGYILMDFASKKVSVYPVARGPTVPKIGSLVIGSTTRVQSSTATIRIMKIGERFISGHFRGIIYVSDVSFKYTESMFDAFKVGDLVRAKVISDKNKTYHLSTKGENLGVIYALCSQCGSLLPLKDRGLKCEECGRAEKRKIASDYGTGTL
jgi:exosome complex component CSL4